MWAWWRAWFGEVINLTDYRNRVIWRSGDLKKPKQIFRCPDDPISRFGLPLIELRPVIRVRMGPICTVLLVQLLLLWGKQFPVVQGVRLLDDTHERRRLSRALLLEKLNYFCQAAAKIIAAMRQVKFRIDIDHVALAQLGHVTGIALCPYLAKARFAGTCFFSCREVTTGF